MTKEEREASFKKDLQAVLEKYSVELRSVADSYNDRTIEAFFSDQQYKQGSFTIALGDTLNEQERPVRYPNIEKVKYQFVTRYNGHMQAFYNPNNILIADLPTIYGYTLAREGTSLIGQLIAEDGTVLATQACSSEIYMLSALGIIDNTNEKHKVFKGHYPDGYKMELVLEKETPTHAGLSAVRARQLNRIINGHP